jgi:MHS family proline/betaine transporter-like MFS transporter
VKFERTKSVAAAAIGNVLEWYDFSIYAYAAGTIGRKFFPDADETASLLAAFAAFGVGFVVRPIGGIVIGRLGDLRGRKPALMATVLLMAVGTVGIGILPDRQAIGTAAPLLLVLCRFIQGFSAGGEWGSSTAFVVEWAPAGRRGFFGSLQQASVCGGLLLGSVSAALVDTWLTPDQTGDWGWRIPFLAGGVLAPVGLYLRRNVGEPPAFRAVRTLPTPLRPGSGWVLAAKACGFTTLWTVAYYTMLGFIPTFTQLFAGLGAAQALWSNAAGLLVLMALTPACGALSDRIGRKPLLLSGCIGFILLSYPLFLLMVSGATLRVVVLVQMAFAALIALFSGPGPAAIAEIFPTSGRSTWMSAGYSVATAVFGGFAPYVATGLIAVTGSPLAPTYYLIAAALVSTVVIAGLRESAHDPLG